MAEENLLLVPGLLCDATLWKHQFRYLAEPAEITIPDLTRQDAMTPLEVHEEMLTHIPHSRLAVIEDCGHASTMERPQAVTALLRDWLLFSHVP